MNFTATEVERYARHLVLREIGGPGQQRLKAARALLVGAGGLGAPAALYLAAAGVGRLTLLDDDAVSLSNLQRQILFKTADVGRAKVAAGAEALEALNPHITVDPRQDRITETNAAALVEAHDVVIDGSDSFETRLLVNAACVKAGRPLISGAIGRWSGQIARFGRRPCYQCLVPEIPPGVAACETAGVLGALAGVIGSLMALETIKTLTEAAESVPGRLFILDALSLQSRTVTVAPDPSCPVCAGGAGG
jgi:molybdopterin/thiamine biosynthesis adenylyltransferase